ncbi:MAG: ppiD [Verrucomicrobiales bacterium]|nr:ppiD [Verrucomicrobiales bacterium]
MIGTIRKHQQWLWGLIITATIVSFVVFFNPSTRYGGGGGSDTRSGETGASIEGRAIGIDEFSEAVREEMLFYFLQHGEWASAEKLRQQNYQLDQRAYQRIALNQKAKDLGITPTAKAAARMVEEIFGATPSRPVTEADLQQFEQRTLAPQHLTLDDFARFARHQAANQQLVTLFGMSGKLITPKEAETFYVRENEPMLAEVAYFPLSNYMAQVNVSAKDVEGFYNTNRAMYRLPERVQVQYISFPTSNYVAIADKDLSSNTNLSKEIDAYYIQRGPATFKDEQGKELSPEAAKTKIKNELRDNRAMTFARTNANAVIEGLIKGHDDLHPFTVDDLQNVAKANNLKVNVTEPFDGRTGPTEFKPTQAFMRTAFSLSTNAPEDKSHSMIYSQAPIPYEDGWMVMGLKQRFGSQDQSFAQVQTKVMDDYKREKAYELAQGAGQMFYAKAAGAVTQGKSLSDVAAANNVKTVTLPAFSLATAQPTNIMATAEFKQLEKSNPSVAHLITGRQEFQQLVENIYSLQTGKMSGYVPTAEGGYIVAVKVRQSVDQAKLQKELPEFVARMREQRQNAAFGEWFQKQLQDMRLVIPQQPKQPMS